MVDVLMINSPLFREVNKKYDEDSLPPIGLGYIATLLKSHNLNVELIDAVHERISLVDLLSKIKAKAPKVIAINIFTTNYDIVKDLVEGLHDTSLKVIIGGLSTKELYKKIVEWNTSNPVDIVAGDGEYITYDLIVNAVRERPLVQERNFCFYQVFNRSAYFLSTEDISAVKLDRTFFKNEPTHHPFGFLEANIVTSRGCIYSCSFCAAARLKNRDYTQRERSVESVRQELTEIKRGFPEITSIRVLDDLFLQTVHSIERAISTFQGFDLSWRSMAHVQTFKNVPDALMHKLKTAGCTELFIGIESGSPRILKKIRKTADVEVIKKSMISIFKAGINVKGYFIYGFQDETEADMRMTYELAKFLRDTALQFGVQFRTSPFQYRPYHGTELYDELVDGGKYVDDIISVNVNHELSDSIGRQQFNFHSGNLSSVDTDTLYRYICKTAKLNPDHLFEKTRIKDSNLHL